MGAQSDWRPEPAQPASLEPLEAEVRALAGVVHQLASTPPAPVIVQAPATDTLDVTLRAFTGLGYALSARGLLLLTLVGAFILSVLVLVWQSGMALAVLAAYLLGTVLPVTVLEIRKVRE